MNIDINCIEVEVIGSSGDNVRVMAYGVDKAKLEAAVIAWIEKNGVNGIANVLARQKVGDVLQSFDHSEIKDFVLEKGIVEISDFKEGCWLEKRHLKKESAMTLRNVAT